MSTRLSKALEFANYRVTLNNQNAALKAKTQNLLSYSINGGTFVIDLPLLTFCKQLIDLKHKDAVLLDSFDNPIKVELKAFHKEILSRWFEVTNDYYAEYEKLRRARKVHKILDLNEKEE
jgi:hypothetical protein|tara:strand:+ start:7942 stop:8301 length:360 start_codon:yes stop_codon:yes gene_type:complete